MKYHFFESKFGDQFCEEKTLEVKKLINSAVSFTVAGMPGVGVTNFLRYLAIRDFAHFIYIDSYLLPTLSKKEFFQALLKVLGGKNAKKDSSDLLAQCLNQLQILTTKYPKIVLIFNRFDQLKAEFNSEFFSNIWSLRNVSPDKISIITTANRPISEIAPQSLQVGHLGVFSKIVYLPHFSLSDTKTIVKVSSKYNLIADHRAVETAVNLCGGHYQLLQMLLKSARLSNPLQDQFIKMQLKELYEFVNHNQKKILQKIAFNKPIEEVDEYLLNIGLVIKDKDGYQLFTPLLEKFIQGNIPLRLPVKEARLFKKLKQHLGQVVSKEAIFNLLWPEDSQDYDKASEWALNSLIYRLRKNPYFIQSGYVIENHKKEGFVLIKN